MATIAYVLCAALVPLARRTALPTPSPRASITSAPLSAPGTLVLGDEIGSGTYGRVHEAEWTIARDGRSIDVVAKCARPNDPADESLADNYLNVESIVHEALEERRAIAPERLGCFCRYLGRAEAEGTSWLLWERLPGGALWPRAVTLAELNHETGIE